MRSRPIGPADLDAIIATWKDRLFIPMTVAQLADLLAAHGVSDRIFGSGDARVRLGLLLARLRDGDLGGYVVRLVNVDRHSKQRRYMIAPFSSATNARSGDHGGALGDQLPIPPAGGTQRKRRSTLRTESVADERIA
jgi:hypothetical protein